VEWAGRNLECTEFFLRMCHRWESRKKREDQNESKVQRLEKEGRQEKKKNEIESVRLEWVAGAKLKFVNIVTRGSKWELRACKKSGSVWGKYKRDSVGKGNFIPRRGFEMQ